MLATWKSWKIWGKRVINSMCNIVVKKNSLTLFMTPSLLICGVIFSITHILNVTIEIANFFPDNFRYKSVRLYDLETSDLLPHWNHTWRFIDEARTSGGKCLVHCKMGISRSAATVCAYLMKERLWTKSRALDFIKSKRSIVSPNPSFHNQLVEYEGIVFAR